MEELRYNFVVANRGEYGEIYLEHLVNAFTDVTNSSVVFIVQFLEDILGNINKDQE